MKDFFGLPEYDEENNVIKNYNRELMPELEVEIDEMLQKAILVDYKKEKEKVYLLGSSDGQLFHTTPEKINEDLEEVMDSLYEKARKL